jgi:hypothetical protein
VTTAPTALVLDFLEWVDRQPRSRTEVMDAWRTSCPRLTVWEDATDAAYVRRRPDAEMGEMVEITSLGREFLVLHHRTPIGSEHSQQTSA